MDACHAGSGGCFHHHRSAIAGVGELVTQPGMVDTTGCTGPALLVLWLSGRWRVGQPDVDDSLQPAVGLAGGGGCEIAEGARGGEMGAVDDEPGGRAKGGQQLDQVGEAACRVLRSVPGCGRPVQVLDAECQSGCPREIDQVRERSWQGVPARCDRDDVGWQPGGDHGHSEPGAVCGSGGERG